MYAILRANKISTNADASSLLGHSFRDEKGGHTPHNADPSRAGENSLVGQDSHKEAYQAYLDKLPEKVRKNGVRLVEYLVAASPEAMKAKTKSEQDTYMSDALDWLKKKHGAENVVGAAIHRDEQTPHMHVFVVPFSQERDDQGNLKKPGKLNAREFLGGRAKLSAMQTDFHKAVGEKHGLKRGEIGSRAKHETVRDYYNRVNSDAKIPDIDATEFEQQKLKGKKFAITSSYESGETVKARIMPKIEEELKSAHAILQESKANQRKAESKQARAEKSLDRFSGMEEYTKLSKEDQQLIQEQVSLLKTKRKMEAVKKENDLPKNKDGVRDDLER